MRNWIVFGVLFMLILISFMLFGDTFSKLFAEENMIQFFRDYGKYAWLIGILLLIADLFLPLPGTIIMSTMGFVYGPWIGGLLAVAGNFLSGMLAFFLCLALGEKGSKWILGDRDYTKGHQLFRERGGYIVALSRWLPILPEAISCIAGLNRMPVQNFVIALLCGSLPLGFIFAYIGYRGLDEPLLAIVVSAILPLVLWILAQFLLRKTIKQSRSYRQT